MAGDSRPPIDSDLKRKVRQKCAFGCVMCGNPICDIDHIENFADVQEHELNNLTLLCTMHHRQKTNGILSPDVVRERTESIRHVAGCLPDLNFPECTLIIGDNIVRSVTGNAFEVYNKDFFRVTYDNELKQVVINAAFYDRNGSVAFRIEDNIYSTSTDVWDVELIGNQIIFREGHYKRFLVVMLDGLTNTITITGKIFISDTYFLDLKDSGIHCHGYMLASRCIVDRCGIGIMIADEEVIIRERIVGGFMGGRVSNGYVEECPVGFVITNERIKGIFDKYPKGRD